MNEQHGECPVCGRALRELTNVGDTPGPPEPGDWSVCAACAAPLVFDEDLALRCPTRQEVLRLAENPRDLKKLIVTQMVICEERRAAARRN